MEFTKLNFDKQLIADHYIDLQNCTDYFSDIHVSEIDKIADDYNYYHKLNSERLNEEFPFLFELFKKVYSGLVSSQGVYLLRGFPTERYSVDRIKLIYQIIGKLLGKVLPQNMKKEVVTDIINIEKDNIANIRGYLTDSELEFHTDACDFVALLCLSKAHEGGVSKVASSILIYKIINSMNFNLAKVAFSDLSVKNIESLDSNDHFSFPIYKLFKDEIYSRLVPGYTKRFLNGGTVSEVQKLQLELLELIQLIADSPECHLSMMLEPGDIQFLNNNKTYHSRTKFINSKTHKRHLLRLWLKNENFSVYPDIFI